MDSGGLKRILKNVARGRSSVSEALEALKAFPYDDLGFAKIDTHRELRKGFPEVVFCLGKSRKQIERIFRRIGSSSRVMATRASHEVYEALKAVRRDAVYYEKARIVFAGRRRKPSGKPVLIASAGTSDIPVAEEAAVTAEILANRVERLFDIGAAGIHRLLANRRKIMAANVVVVVAGMDGVLPTLVGGVARRPVIAVPTSVGYGAHFGGIAPLLTILNSCSPGVAAVNIDNGFGAGYLASLINGK